MQNVFEVLKPPFRYDDYGQKIFDSKNTLCLDVRGWGSFQKNVNGAELQERWGEFVTEALNKASSNSDRAECAHEFVSRDYIEQPNGRCISCGDIVY